MAKKKKPKDKQSSDISININIIGEGYMRRCAISAGRNDLFYMHTFDHIEANTDWNEKVNAAIAGLVAAEVAPPPDIKTSKDDVVGKPKEEIKAKVPAGYVDWEAPDDDMPWQPYPAFVADVSKPVVKGQTKPKVAAAVVEAVPKHPVLTLEQATEPAIQKALF